MHRIGPWVFDAREGVLRRDGEERRLEDRSARVLEMLCRHRGDVVSKNEILSEVWQGRAVSGNSVAIAIGDIRRSLGEGSSEPVHIVTVAKRGYRLNTAPDASEPDTSTARRRATAPTIGALLLIATAAVAGFECLPRRTEVELVVSPTRNETGASGYDALARSMSAVVTNGVTRFPQVRVVASGASSEWFVHRVSVDSRLIIWNGAPEVAITATDDETQGMIWSTFANGDAGNLARDAGRRLLSLRRRVARIPRQWGIESLADLDWVSRELGA